MTDRLIHAVAVNLFWIVLTAAVLAAVPTDATGADCWLPPNAPIRGLYEACWGFWDIWR